MMCIRPALISHYLVHLRRMMVLLYHLPGVSQAPTAHSGKNHQAI